MGIRDIGVHNLWSSVHLCVRDVQRAAYQVKMVTGTYTLQSHRHKYSKGKESAECPLCTSNMPETMVHFLGQCDSTESIRQWYITEAGLPATISPETLSQTALDPTRCGYELGHEIFYLSRLYCFKVHHHRASVLGYRTYPGAKLTRPSDDTTISTTTPTGDGRTTGGGRRGGGDRPRAGCPPDGEAFKTR